MGISTAALVHCLMRVIKFALFVNSSLALVAANWVSSHAKPVLSAVFLLFPLLVVFVVHNFLKIQLL